MEELDGKNNFGQSRVTLLSLGKNTRLLKNAKSIVLSTSRMQYQVLKGDSKMLK